MPYRVLPVFLLLLAACASTETPGDGTDAPAQAPRRAGSAPVGPLRLVRDAPDVRTVQLYPGSDERALPVLALGGGETLTLEFDLLTDDARPLSIYLQHADRTWRRDLLPIQYLDGFEREDVLTYERSRFGSVRYVHYRHTLPGRGARFRVSGNYVARVTELGNPDAVLFERPFFVAETGVPVSTGLADGPMPVGIGPALLPLVRVSTRGLDPAPFGYTACFVLSGRFEAPRCAERPLTVQPDAVTFTLPAQSAFRTDATHYADLREWSTTRHIARVDLRTDTTRVTLAPDDATFPDVDTPDLLGQAVIREASRTAGDPAVTGEYAWVTFAFVPPSEVPLRDAYLEGAFNGWAPRAVPLAWNAAERRYEGRVLLKQGRYEYRYTSSDPRLARTQSTVLGRPEAALTTFVYYRDPALASDRLLAAPTQRVRP
jgi:hypothetical protein